MGMPEEEWPQFFKWSEAVIPGATDWPEEERQALSAEMVTYLLAAAAERRAHPGEGIISELGAAEIDGDRLTDAELGMFLVQLLVAGNETTRNMMSGGLVGLADRPGAWPSLRSQGVGVGPAGLVPRCRGDAPMDHAGGVVHAHDDPARPSWADVSSAPVSRC